MIENLSQVVPVQEGNAEGGDLSQDLRSVTEFCARALLNTTRWSHSAHAMCCPKISARCLDWVV